MDPVYWQQEQQQAQQQLQHPQQHHPQPPPPWPALMPSSQVAAAGAPPYFRAPFSPPQPPGYSWQHHPQREPSPYLQYQEPGVSMHAGIDVRRTDPPLPPRPYISGGRQPSAHPPFAPSVQPGMFQQHQVEPFAGLHSSAGNTAAGSTSIPASPHVPMCNSSFNPVPTAMPAAAVGEVPPWSNYSLEASGGGREAGGGDGGGGGKAQGGWFQGPGYLGDERASRRHTVNNNSRRVQHE